MKVTFPLMGTIGPVMEDLCDRLGVAAVSPPPITNETVRIGAASSPEFACLPLKITAGNFIQALEAGADTIVMAGGTGPCRFGYYAQAQKKVLRDLGYDFDMIIIEPPLTSVRHFVCQFKRMAPGKSTWELWEIIRDTFAKGKIMDELAKTAMATRAFEREPGATSEAHRQGLELVRKAFTTAEVESAREEALKLFDAVKKDSGREPLRIGVVGEFYVAQEPFVNFDLEEFLGKKGAYVERSVYMTDWVNPSSENPVSGVDDHVVQKEAEDYLGHTVGGEGQATLGHIVRFAKEGFDGVVHLFPFTCMPEIIAKSIFPRITKDYDIPILSLVIDEQTGKAGVVTRLEAFLDLVRSKKQQRKSAAARA
ncbi:MAG: CoA protein activase [Terriglobia bacterium]